MAWFTADERTLVPSQRRSEKSVTGTGLSQSQLNYRPLVRNPVRNDVPTGRALPPRVAPEVGSGQTSNRPRGVRLRPHLLGIPLALLGADVVAVVVQSAVVGPTTARAVLFGLLILLCRASVRHYRPRMHMSVLDDLPRALGSTLAAVGLTLAVTFIASPNDHPHQELVQRAGLFVLTSLVLDTLIFAAGRRVRRARRGGKRTLIVGAGRVGVALTDALLDFPELGLDPVGFMDVQGDTLLNSTPAPVLAARMSELGHTIRAHDIDTAILAFDDGGDTHVDTLMAVHRMGCQILLVPSMFEMHHDGPDVERVRGIPLLRLRPDPTSRPSWWVKRGVDMAIGALGLLLIAVPAAIIALAILIDSGRPVLFWQERVGLDGHTFRLCKFRSLRPESEDESRTMWNVAADPRVSRLGKLLRKSSIDEVPQLWNILRGQMSLVGPRPERPTFVQKFSAEHDRYWARHRVPVGLTGLAQVNGLRGDTSILERSRYDNYYIANWSLWLDVKVIMLTAREVLGGHGR